MFNLTIKNNITIFTHFQVLKTFFPIQEREVIFQHTYRQANQIANWFVGHCLFLPTGIHVFNSARRSWAVLCVLNFLPILLCLLHFAPPDFFVLHQLLKNSKYFSLFSFFRSNFSQTQHQTKYVK
jgi:magnesium-transporting ATPase (P-type)